MKGVWGPLTSLIILVASVVISLVVVFLAYSILGGHNQLVVVTQASPGMIKDGKLYISLQSNSQVKIVKLQVGGYSETLDVVLKPGINNVTLPLPPGFSPVKCQMYSFMLVLDNGHTVMVNAEYYC